MKNIVVSTALVLALSMTLVSASDESTAPVSKTSKKILAEIMHILEADGILEAEEQQSEEPEKNIQDAHGTINLALEAEAMEQPSSVKSAAEEDVEEEAASDPAVLQSQQTGHPASNVKVSTARNGNLAEIMEIFKEELVLAKQMRYLHAMLSAVSFEQFEPVEGRRGR